MRLDFLFPLCALTALFTEAKPIENLPRFTESLVQPLEPEIHLESVQQELSVEVATHASTPELEEITLGSSNSTEPSTSAETAASIKSSIEVEAATPSTATVSTIEPMTTFVYTDEFHPDPILTAAIKAAKSPIYQRIREPPSQEYSYDFLQEV